MNETRKLIMVHALRDLTAEMLDWWFDNMGPVERYRLWHPKDHVSFEWEVPPSEHGAIGSIHVVEEYIGPELVRLRIRREDPSQSPVPTKYGHVVVASNLAPDDTIISQVVHEWEDLTGGVVRLRTTFVLPAEAPDPFVAALRQHSTEEANNFPSFLPRLYEEATGRKSGY